MRRIAVCALLAAACGKQASGQASVTPPPVTTPPPAPVTIQLSPQSVNLPPNGTQQFKATVAGAQDTSVRWMADAGVVTDDTMGTILYTAPASDGTYHVTVTSVADTKVTATATITVASSPIVGITLDPQVANLRAGTQAQFHAAVTGSPDHGVIWSADGGSVDAQGLYTAPAASGTFHVTARSHADPTKSAQASVSVTATPQIAVSISPGSAAVQTGQTMKFTAAVTGTSDTAVTWSTDFGAVDQSGLYTAPATAGTAHVTVTSHADPTKSDQATVTVLATGGKVAVSIDPATATLELGQSVRLGGQVVGTTDTRLNWTADNGTVTGGGYYTPANAGTWHVTATSVADPTASATATITVTANGVHVTLSPAQMTAAPNTMVKFTATVTGTTDARVHFSLCCNVAYIAYDDGSIDTPSADGTYQVTAQSLADPNQKATATLWVVTSGSVAVRVDPTSGKVKPGGTIRINAYVNGTSNTAVTWSVDGGAANGTVDASGTYTAPMTIGTYYVRATSVADPKQSAAATISVDDNNLRDHGGAVDAAPRVFALWWGDATQFPADNRTAVETLFKNVTGSGYASVLDEYMRGGHAAVSFMGSYADPSARNNSIAVEACSFFDQQGIAPANGDMVFVYTADFPDSGGGFCAWHAWTSCKGANIIVAYMPNMALTGSCRGLDLQCNGWSQPANVSASITAHELFESITNPYATAWYDSSSEEIGDKCAWSDTCVSLNGMPFQLQRQWSNAANGCVP